MHEDVFRAIDEGATIVTSSRRLARAIREGWHSRQRARGRSTWSIPDVLPFDSLLERTWRNWVLRGATDDCPRLLDAIQEQVIWEQIIRTSPAGETLLQISETARSAMQAWQLVQAHRVPLDARLDSTDDGAAFRDWAQQFRDVCETHGWLEHARLSDTLLQQGTAGDSPMCFFGFDDLTPQAAEFFEKSNARPIPASTISAAKIDYCKAADSAQEILHAAEWARNTLAREPAAQIGIIVPGLTRLRAKVERIFGLVLDPAGTFEERYRPFHLSLGPPLGEYPLVRAAHLFLRFGTGSLTLPDAGVFLRSPFLGDAESELSPRALLDAQMRSRGGWNISVAMLWDGAARCPALQRLLSRFGNELNRLPEKQSARAWTRSFSRILEALGWPGERPLTSFEYQGRRAWEDLLSTFAGVDLALGPMALDQALSRLQDIAGDTPFQVENEGAPVQVMGMLEAAGLTFDHLWIMGLTDEALPAPVNPNPFIPALIQREYGLPRSSSERELEFSSKLLGRLLSAAPRIVLSYPEWEGDRRLAPSPLVSSGPWSIPDTEATLPDWIARIRSAALLETVEDGVAPPLRVEGLQSGGSSLFKDMAACPFRAFAKHRLNARPLDEATPGLSYRDRGNAAHRALDLIWSEIRSHSRLRELNPNQLAELVAQHVHAALKDLGDRPGSTLERRRLKTLLLDWLGIEAARDPFVVLAIEDKRDIAIAGLQIRTRTDRVDTLPDGRTIIIDYKTGQLNSTAWDTDRPDDPQLPLYCVSSDKPIAAAAFAQIRTGELGFRGLSDPSTSLPEMRRMRGEYAQGFGEQVARWKSVLETLGENFRAGVARVDPKHGACDNCGLNALCRIEEFERDR